MGFPGDKGGQAEISKATAERKYVAHGSLIYVWLERLIVGKINLLNLTKRKSEGRNWGTWVA